MMFRGELLIVAENIWIAVVFLVFLNFSSVYTIVMTFVNRKIVRYKGIRIQRLDQNIVWNSIWAVFNIFIGIVFIILAFYLSSAIGGLLGVGEAFLQYIIIGILLINGITPIIPGVIWFSKIFRGIKNILPEKRKLINGMVGFGLCFIFLISSFGVSILSTKSQFSSGLITRQDVFMAGELYNGYPNGFQGQPPITGYRIPSLISLPEHTLLAFAEAHADPWNDFGNIDLVERRSVDDGMSWSNMMIVADFGDHTAGNPCPVYDNTTGVLFMMYNLDNEQVFVKNSTDAGLTWSAPENLTSSLGIITIPGTFHTTIGCGPGNGIQLSTGRLVVPSYFFNSSGSFVIYSDDHGTTWHRGGTVGTGAEAQVVEGVNGSLYINMRNTGNAYNCREIAWSNDGGLTWSKPYVDTALPDVPCQASVCRLSTNITSNLNRLLYAGPNDHVRGHYVVRLSYDEGKTWSIEKELYSGPAAYGDLVVLNDHSIGLLFECGKYDYREGIQFVRFDLSWLTDGQDSM